MPCFGDLDHAFEEVEVDALRRRVAGESSAPASSAAARTPRSPCAVRLEEVVPGHQRHVADVGAGDDEAVGVDRVGRVRHQHRVARPHVASARWPGPPSSRWSRWPRSPGRDRRRSARCTSGRSRGAGAGCRATPSSDACRRARAASTSLSTMCCGVGWSGLPMPKSMMSSPRARASGLQFVDDGEDVGRQRLIGQCRRLPHLQHPAGRGAAGGTGFDPWNR
jgi:hypothetical protein